MGRVSRRLRRVGVFMGYSGWLCRRGRITSPSRGRAGVRPRQNSGNLQGILGGRGPFQRNHGSPQRTDIRRIVGGGLSEAGDDGDLDREAPGPNPARGSIPECSLSPIGCIVGGGVGYPLADVKQYGPRWANFNPSRNPRPICHQSVLIIKQDTVVVKPRRPHFAPCPAAASRSASTGASTDTENDYPSAFLGGNGKTRIRIPDAPDSQLLAEGAMVRRCKPWSPLGEL